VREAAVSELSPAVDVCPDGVIIRRLATLEEYQEAVAIQDETWGAGFSERVPAAILNVSQKVGGVTAGAFDADGRMLGFVFGLTGFLDGRPVHWSDMLAVRVEARGRHLGDHLKKYQRRLVREMGVETMFWTFDPLVARNAHFNINRLGARPAEYIPNMYGSKTGSALHGALDTDRFVAAWDLREDRPAAVYGREHTDAPIVNATRADGTPSLGTLVDAPRVRVEIPREIQEEQRAAPSLAAQWRAVTRGALQHYLTRGYAVTGFLRSVDGERPSYILTRITGRSSDA
jgi:predicted GNAT superfamily acetyltransferase